MSVRIGLKDVYYALLTNDPSVGSATYDTPVKISGAMQANINPNASLETLFADDGPYEVATTIGQINLELGMADIDLPTQAVLLGHTYSGGILIRKGSDVPPWVAIGFRSLKSNGKYRYTWLAKGKFSIPEQQNETKGDTINFQNTVINGNFVKRDCDDEWERHIDEDDVDFYTALATDWFTSPYGGAADATAPVITCVPVDGATGVVVSANIVFTSDDALQLTTVTTDNFFVVDNVTGALIAGALTIDATRKIVTFNPTNNLSAATAYKAIVTTNVKNASGVALAAPLVIDFTTA